jgi:hypothetical protein
VRQRRSRGTPPAGGRRNLAEQQAVAGFSLWDRKQVEALKRPSMFGELDTKGVLNLKRLIEQDN